MLQGTGRSQPPQWRWVCTDGNKASFSGHSWSLRHRSGRLIQGKPRLLVLRPSKERVPILFHLSVQGFLLCADSKSPNLQRIFLASFANRRLKNFLAQCRLPHLTQKQVPYKTLFPQTSGNMGGMAIVKTGERPGHRANGRPPFGRIQPPPERFSASLSWALL